MSAWSVLPNAAHIDRVLASIRQHHDVWAATYDATWVAARDAAWEAAWNAAYDAGRAAAWIETWSVSWGGNWAAAWNEAWRAGRDATRSAMQGSTLALVAYDDCNRYLDMTAEQLELWARLSDEPAAVLLLPYMRVLEHIKPLESV